VNIYDLVDRARSLSGIRLESIRSDTQVEEAINEAYQEILGMHPWPFLRGEISTTLVAGVDSAITPEQFRFITALVLTDGQETIRLEAATLDELDRRGQQEGAPKLYARVDETELKFWPTPTSNYTLTVRGQLELPRLTGNVQPVFADQYHPAIAYRAAARMLVEEGDDSGRSQAYQSEASEYVRRMEKHYLGTGDIAPIRMGGRGRQRHGYRY
jgi:hypothetical protein